MTQSSKIAVFFDAENISGIYVKNILSELQKYGRIVLRRAYADWSISNMQQTWKKVLFTIPLTPIQCFHKENEKETADKALIMDAVEATYNHPDIDIFCIAASDKGYSSLALRLQEQGKFVLGIGEKEKSSPILRDSCNEFLYVEDIPAVDEKIVEALSVPASVEEKENGRLVLLSFITEILKVTKKREDGFVFLSDFGIAVTTYKSDFNYRSYGFNSLKRMIESFGDEFEIISDGREKPAYLFRMRTADNEEFGQSQKTMKLQGKK